MAYDNPYAATSDQGFAAFAEESERAGFIQRTYLHLTGAVITFVILEGLLLTAFPAETILQKLGPMLGGYGWLLFLGAFMVVSWLARSWAESGSSTSLQYAGLGLYVVAEAVIFLPLMAFAIRLDPAIPLNAGIVTGVVFVGLTAFTFFTRADFSGWGRYLFLGGLVALGMIVVGTIFGFGLGLWFSVAMVALAAGYILYDTSNVLHHYRTDQHVAASLALFASLALLLWYVIRIFMSLRDE